jgi:Pectate lyase superfamily protein
MINFTGSRLAIAFLARLSLSLIVLSSFASVACANPVIINFSNIAGAENIVNLQGNDFGDHPTVWCSTNGAKAVQTPVINGGNGVLHIRMRSPLGLYCVSVKNGSAASNTVYLNRAKPMHFDTPEVSPTGQFRIFGRNLHAAGFRPQVTFMSRSKNYNATVNLNPSYNSLLVTAPSDIPKGTYTICVSNGMGSWDLGQAQCQEKMTIRDSGPDTFKLGVPWAADLTFGNNVYDVRSDPRLKIHAVADGDNNDQPAIQNAIEVASTAGGGVVYLPAGTYKMQNLSGPLMKFANNVVLQGASQDKTTINYGYGKPGPDFIVAMFFRASKCGLCDLSIQNLNQNDAWLDTRTIANGGGNANQLFLARVTANIQNGFRIDLEGDRILVENCDLTSVYTLLFMSQCTNSRVANNTLTQKLGVHLDLTLSNRCIVENNTFSLNANNGQIVTGNVRHGMAIGFAHNLAIIRNDWSIFNGWPAYNNDGESILSEGGAGNRIGEETGTVTNANGTSVNLSKSVGYVAGTVIAIINGAGTGQWRTITARQGCTLAIDSPWAVLPDNTSNYSIFVWSDQNTTIAGNTFTNWLRGIWIYQGSTVDTQITDNHFNTMDGIFIEPCQNINNGNGQFNPVWNTVVDNNTLISGLPDRSSSTQKRDSAATYINFTGDLQQTTKLIGTMCLNNQVFGNTLTGSGATFFENDPAQTEGYCNYLRVEAPHYDDQSIPAMLGTIFQWNTADSCGAQAYLLNGGDYQTTIDNNTNRNLPELIQDSKKYWNTAGTHQSVGTVIFGNSSICVDGQARPSR